LSSYELEDWSSYAWSVEPPDLDLFSLSGDSDFIQLREVPFGCLADPVAKLTLFATWRYRTYQTSTYVCQSVFRIHDILGWIRIRILGSMLLTNGSGSGSCYYRH
jgi:hypothetical protein